MLHFVESTQAGIRLWYALISFLPKRCYLDVVCVRYYTDTSRGVLLQCRVAMLRIDVHDMIILCI